MKTMKLLIGTTELIMALAALIAVLTSKHPIAETGWLLVVLLGGKGLLYIYLALGKGKEYE